MTVPSKMLNNNIEMPAIGLGTWQAYKGEVGEAVKLAIDLGYRHFDCAYLYQNEQEIGEAIRSKIDEGVVKREDLFIVSKLWSTYHRPDLVVKGCRKSVKNFGLDYIDQYLIHWPIAFKPTDRADLESREIVGKATIFYDEEFMPRDGEGKIIFTDNDYVDTWKAMEDCVELGLTRSIGVSNFSTKQLTRILNEAKIKPVTNQVEMHPYLLQPDLVSYCKKNDIVVVAYCPLGAANEYVRNVSILEHPTVLKVAEEVDRTAAQVVLRFLIQYGVVPIPKSTNPERLKQNISVFDFELTQAQFDEIKQLDCNDRAVKVPGSEGHKNYSF